MPIRPDPACYFYRDRAGFCLLENRCWSGKPCPKTQRQADAARSALVNHHIRAFSVFEKVKV